MVEGKKKKKKSFGKKKEKRESSTEQSTEAYRFLKGGGKKIGGEVRTKRRAKNGGRPLAYEWCKEDYPEKKKTKRTPKGPQPGGALGGRPGLGEKKGNLGAGNPQKLRRRLAWKKGEKAMNPGGKKEKKHPPVRRRSSEEPGRGLRAGTGLQKSARTAEPKPRKGERGLRRFLWAGREKNPSKRRGREGGIRWRKRKGIGQAGQKNQGGEKGIGGKKREIAPNRAKGGGGLA